MLDIVFHALKNQKQQHNTHNCTSHSCIISVCVSWLTAGLNGSLPFTCVTKELFLFSSLLLFLLLVVILLALASWLSLWFMQDTFRLDLVLLEDFM